MKTNKDNNYNLVLYSQLILTALGVMWLALNDVKSGTIYVTLFLMISVLFLLSFLFIKEKDNTAYGKFRTPLTSDYDIAIPLYLIGWTLPFIINSLIGIFSNSFSVTSFMIPMSAGSLDNAIVQSFAIAQLQSDAFIRLFMMVFVAGTIEELLFGWFLVAIFYLLGKFILKLINNEKDLPFMSASNFKFWFGIIGSVLVFSGVHNLNSTYAGAMFVIAMIFRLIMNLSIYAWGLFLSFTIGYHQANNFIYFLQANGSKVVLSALFTLKGLVIISFFVLMVIYTLKNIEKIKSKLSRLLI